MIGLKQLPGKCQAELHCFHSEPRQATAIGFESDVKNGKRMTEHGQKALTMPGVLKLFLKLVLTFF